MQYLQVPYFQEECQKGGIRGWMRWDDATTMIGGPRNLCEVKDAWRENSTSRLSQLSPS